MQVIKEYKKGELVYDNCTDFVKIEVDLVFDRVKVNFEEIINSQFTGGNLQAGFNSVKSVL